MAREVREASDPIDECALDRCTTLLFPGDEVWKRGPDMYCCLAHLVEDAGAITISADGR